MQPLQQFVLVMGIVMSIVSLRMAYDDAMRARAADPKRKLPTDSDTRIGRHSRASSSPESY